jgi:hypothetical protein
VAFYKPRSSKGYLTLSPSNDSLKPALDFIDRR